MGQEFTISLADVARIVTEFDGHLAQFAGGAADLGRLAVPAAGYGQVGGGAAGANRDAQEQLLVTLRAVETVLRELNQRVGASAHGYDVTDRQFAADFQRY